MPGQCLNWIAAVPTPSHEVGQPCTGAGRGPSMDIGAGLGPAHRIGHGVQPGERGDAELWPNEPWHGGCSTSARWCTGRAFQIRGRARGGLGDGRGVPISASTAASGDPEVGPAVARRGCGGLGGTEGEGARRVGGGRPGSGARPRRRADGLDAGAAPVGQAAVARLSPRGILKGDVCCAGRARPSRAVRRQERCFTSRRSEMAVAACLMARTACSTSTSRRSFSSQATPTLPSAVF